MSKQLMLSLFALQNIDEDQELITTPSTPMSYDSNFEFITNALANQIKQYEVKSRSVPFTEYEDQIIEFIVRDEQSKSINWNSITDALNNSEVNPVKRTSSEVYERWHRVLNPQYVKGPWSNEEDNQLISQLNLPGDVSYSQIAKIMVKRSDIQIRYRVQTKLLEWIEQGRVAESRRELVQ